MALGIFKNRELCHATWSYIRAGIRSELQFDPAVCLLQAIRRRFTCSCGVFLIREHVHDLLGSHGEICVCIIIATFPALPLPFPHMHLNPKGHMQETLSHLLPYTIRPFP